MNKMKILFLIALSCMAFMSCGESLEDTFAEYAGGGETRYLGKCTDIVAIPGWKRIILNWNNNTDSSIKHTKIVWKSNGITDSTIVDRGVNELNIKSLNGEGLVDGTYEITLTALDDRGNTSLPQTTYCRPFTPTHEAVTGFTRVISKIYVLKHRLILSTTGWSDEVKKAELRYIRQDGKQAVLEITPEIANQHFYMLTDVIDETKPITLIRTGELPECGDIIDFDPVELDAGRTFESSFRQEMLAQYGLSDLTDEWVNSVKTLYFDYDISTLVDIMNLPNLKTLVLGSHRYQLDSGISDATYGQSSIGDLEASNFAIKVMGELYGTKVEIYNENYQGLTGSNVKRMGKPKEPSVKFIDLKGATVTNSQESDVFPSYVERLIDGDKSTYWAPRQETEFSVFDLIIDLKSERNLNGLRVVQQTFSILSELSVAPSFVRVYVSKDGERWSSATYLEESTIGRSNGESSYINFTPEIAKGRYRYVKVQVNAGSFRGYYYSRLAELSLY